MRIKSIVIPVCLFIYMCIMAYVGKDRFYNPDTRLTYILSLVFELLIVIVLFFVMRRRDRLRKEREDDISGTRK